MFHSARIQLTLWYLLVIMTISFMFSAVIYGMLGREIDRFERLHRIRIQTHMNTPRVIEPDSELTQELRTRILLFLGVVNGGIFLAAGGFGYILSGRTLRPIQEMVEEQNRFVSDASHELRTPLTSLKTAMEVYLRGKNPDPDETQTLIRESIAEVDKLHKLAASLLTLAHLQDQPVDSYETVVSIPEVLESLKKRMTPLAAKKDIAIAIAAETDALVLGSFDALLQVFTILTDNAIKYSPHGSQVQITQKIKDKCVSISVSDEGPGIDGKHKKSIFRRFYRISASREEGEKGYGLGLSIAEKITKEHKGSISIKNVKPHGSEFVVRLPTY